MLEQEALDLDERAICFNLVPGLTVGVKFMCSKLSFCRMSIFRSFGKAFLVVVVGLVLTTFKTAEPSRPVNRHMPFWTELFRDSKNNGVSANAFFSDSRWKFEPLDRRPKVHKPFGGVDLDLKTLAEANKIFQSQSGIPVKEYFEGAGATGLAVYKGRSVPMEPFVDTTTKGMSLSFHNKWEGLVDPALEYVKIIDRLKTVMTGAQVFVGAELPLVNAHRMATYEPGFLIRNENRKKGTNGEIVNEKLRGVLSQMASDAGLKIGNWSATGLGDLNAYVGLGNRFDYALKCRSIDVSAAAGITLPSGTKCDPDNPLSFSFGREAVAFHANLMAQIELKRGLKVGGTFEWNSRAKSKQIRRLPLKAEAEGWGPLREETTLYSGNQIRVSPYVTFENFMDWLCDFTVGYSYLKSGQSEWQDNRSNPAVQSFVNNPTSMSNVDQRLSASKWDSKFFHLKLSYDPAMASADWPYNPVIWLSYDHPFERDVDVSHRRFGAGITFRF